MADVISYTISLRISSKIVPHLCLSKRCCAVSILIGDRSLLCMSVYFPANYHDSHSNDSFLYMLAEIEGFIDTVSFELFLLVILILIL